MKKYLSLLILTVIALTSCRTRKVDVSVAEKEEKASVQIVRENEAVKELQELTEKVEKSRVFNFSQALSLSPVIDSTGVAQPVKYKELRNGEPYREITIVGGALNESKESKTQEHEKLYNNLVKQNDKLRSQLSKAVEIIEQLDIYQRKVEAKGMQFGVYLIIAIVLLIAMLLGYVEYRIRKFKKLLK